MGQVIALRTRQADAFGSCPECGRRTGVMNVGKAHWLYCELHLTKWHGGYSLLARSTTEDDSTWLANAARLRDYREVEPLPWRWVVVGAPDAVGASDS